MLSSDESQGGENQKSKKFNVESLKLKAGIAVSFNLKHLKLET
jgi:hypothetical protein